MDAHDACDDLTAAIARGSVRLVLALSCLMGYACTRHDDGWEGELSRFDGSELPVLVIDTHDREIPDEPKTSAEVRVFEHGVETLRALDSSSPDVKSHLGIERRGHSSQRFPKLQYGVELRDASGEPLSMGLLGMPAAANWVLGAPFMDKSLMRNHLAYELSRAIGLYAPRTAFVELFLDDDGASRIGLEHYRGVYVLTEKIERGADRVSITSLAGSDTSEPEVSGGYLLEWTNAERLGDSDRWFQTPSGAVLRIAYPLPKQLTKAQQDWITDYVAAVERSLSDSSDRYDEWIDPATFVRYFLLNELLRNADVFFDSTFIYKDREGLLCMGPPWDFDRAYGDVGCGVNSEAEGFQLPKRGWAKYLLRNAHFSARYRTTWQELRQGPLKTESIVSRIDAAVRALGDSPSRNFEKWTVLGKYVPVNHPPYSKTFEEEIDKVKAWLTTRADWLDAHMQEL
ncbi:MAG: CotH kinase family protein [Polyangiaceae bacterium]|nr:CotH kinase family protein [Polyangiaceae bacterium]